MKPRSRVGDGYQRVLKFQLCSTESGEYLCVSVPRILGGRGGTEKHDYSLLKNSGGMIVRTTFVFAAFRRMSMRATRRSLQRWRRASKLKALWASFL